VGVSSSDQSAATSGVKPPLIDRVVAPLGARRFVTGRPGMGWLLTEFSPAQLWCALTGALWLDGYNLVLYLTLLGATVSDLAWLPLVNYSGFALSVLFIVLRPPQSDAKTTCVKYTFIARSIFLGVIAWPLVTMWLGCGTNTVLFGVFMAIFFTALFGNVGVASFMTWTAAVIPREERGSFYRWRNLCAFAVVTVALHLTAWAWPDTTAHPQTELPWLMGLFFIATIIVILSTFGLAWSPAMPARDVAAPPHSPLWTMIRQVGGGRRFLIMGALNTATMACVLPYIPRLLHELGMEGHTYASLQGNVQVPLMLAGIIIAGYALHRLGGNHLLRLTIFILLLGDGLFLFLTTLNLPTLTLWCLAFAGLARGLASIAWIGRVQELAPAHDTRFPLLYLGLSGVAGMLTGGILMIGVPWLEHYHAHHPHTPSPVWVIVAFGVALRGVSLLISLTPVKPHRMT
jgi:hypothetical protein